MKLFEVFEDEQNFYMVLELMTGGEVVYLFIYNLIYYIKILINFIL